MYENKQLINSTHVLQSETNCTSKVSSQNWELLALLTAFNALSWSSYSMNKKLIKENNGFFKMYVHIQSEMFKVGTHSLVSPFSDFG